MDYLRGKDDPLDAEVLDTVIRMKKFRDKVREGGKPTLSAAANYVDTAVQMCWLLEPLADPQVEQKALKNGLVLLRKAVASDFPGAHREPGKGWQDSARPGPAGAEPGGGAEAGAPPEAAAP